MPLDEDTIEHIGDYAEPDSDAAVSEAAAGAIVAARIAGGSGRAFARFGNTLTLTDTATSTDVDFVGLVRLVPFPEMRALFTETETDGWARPLYKVHIAGDWRSVGDGPFAGDTVALPDGAGGPGDTVSYTVRKVDRTYIGSAVHRTLLYLARENP